MRPIQVHYYELPNVKGLAVVRFTDYDTKHRAKRVQQRVYDTGPDDYLKMQDEVEAALERELDVTVLSSHDIGMFPVIAQYVC